nr:MATE family efflux transporter [Clostridium novyi]
MGKEVLILIGLKKELLEYGQVYTLIVGGFLFLQGIISACTAIVRTHGRPNVSLKITFLMVVLNLFLDYVLVYGIFIFPSLGVAGAAIATTISRFIGALILFIYVFKNFETLSSFKIIKNFPKKVLKELMKIGIPSALESLSYNVVQIILTSLILRYLSKEDIAARTYVFQLATFVYVFCLSIAQSNQILIGYSVGEKNYDMANKTCMLSMKLSLIITMIMSFMAALFRYKLISIFTTDEKVILIGAGILIADIAVEFGRTFNLIFISGLRGASDVIFPVVMALISMWGISLGLAIVSIYNGWGIIGIWLSVALDECFRGICMLIRWKSKKWINKKQI